VEATKQRIMSEALASEIRSLSHQLERITEASRRYRVFLFHLSGITDAIWHTIASMSYLPDLYQQPRKCLSTRSVLYWACYRSCSPPPPTNGSVDLSLCYAIRCCCKTLQLQPPKVQPLIMSFVMATPADHRASNGKKCRRYGSFMY